MAPTRSSLFLLPVLAVAALSVVACSSSASGSSALAEVGISRSAGGVISVDVGVLAGFRLVIPPDSLQEDTAIAVHFGVSDELVGQLAVGPAARMSPNGTVFTPSAILTLPVDLGLLPADTTVADLVVIVRNDGTGQLEELTPNSVDEVARLVEVDLPHLSTAWVSVVLPPLDLVTYMPFGIGDEYILRGDVSGEIATLRVEAGPQNGNFPSPDLRTLSVETDGLRSGFYIEIAANGDLLVVGLFVDDGVDSLEEVHTRATMFMPALIEDGDGFHTEADYTGHVPVGDPNIAYIGSFIADTEIFKARQTFQTPAGDFPEPVIFVREEEWMDSDGFSGLSLTALALVADLGVIALEIDDFETFLLIDGTVGGLPILLPEGLDQGAVSASTLFTRSVKPRSPRTL